MRYLEDNPLFNAGKGAVFTNEGKNELDASIMNGKTIGSRISSRRDDHQKSHQCRKGRDGKKPTCDDGGQGSRTICKATRIGKSLNPSYFYTDDRWRALQNAKFSDSMENIKSDSVPKKTSGLKQPGNNDNKYGTDGAVALDRHGNLAAATSTGGMTNKRFGRIGDSPIIGAGTYA